jgi:hypothetical protein
LHYSEPVEEIPQSRLLRKGQTDWEAVAEDFRQDPNTWRVLKIDKYRECAEHMAIYARDKLKEQGLEARKIRHYEEFPGIPDPETGKPEVLRRPLDIYSVHAMYDAPQEKDTTDD